MVMGYGNKISVDVYSIGRQVKVCNLYDSDGGQVGSAHSIKRTRELNGWKELSFTLPAYINGELNWRLDYLKNEYEVRVMDGNEVDWFRLAEPTDTDDGKKAEVKVVCPHVSVLLKKRNLFLEFTDENGIGTLQQLAARALDGTGWKLGHVDTFYEPDSRIEKVRTYNCSTKTGAYTMIQDLCEKFVAYPVFHGDTMTVDLRARSFHDGMVEMRLDKNLAKLARTRDSSDIITRLYVEGEYGDLGYIGIDDIVTPDKPKGLNYIVNFDYYKEIGAMTPEQIAAVPQYLNDAAATRLAIIEAGGTSEPNITKLQGQWGSQAYVIATVENSRVTSTLFGGGATGANAIVDGDTVAAVKSSSFYGYETYSAGTLSYVQNGYVVKFVTGDGKCGGSLAGREVALEAKHQTMDSLAVLIAQAEADGKTAEKEAYQAQFAETQAEYVALKPEASA